MKPTSCRPIRCRWNGTWNCLESIDGAVEPWHGAEQCFGVRMSGFQKQALSRCLFNNLAAVHDRNPIGNTGYDSEIVCDQDHGHAELLLQVRHQLQNLCLDGDVERGRGFVSNEDLGVARQRHGNHDPLLHATTQLMGIVIHALARIRYADQLE